MHCRRGGCSPRVQCSWVRVHTCAMVMSAACRFFQSPSAISTCKRKKGSGVGQGTQGGSSATNQHPHSRPIAGRLWAVLATVH